jgi:squalene-associated FAD-dependent desaturase
MAGLACAVRLAGRGAAVTLYEAARQAGGRCRSYHDSRLGCVIDNGNHLLLSANRAALAYLAEIGAADTLAGPAEAAFPFVDLATGARWTVRPNAGPLPWWVLAKGRRIPGTRVADYLAAARLFRAPAGAAVADVFPPSDPLYRAFWEPMTLACLNASPEQGAAVLLKRVLAESFARGGAHARPLIARDSLAASFVDPALAFLEEAGAEVRRGARLRAIEVEDDRAVALRFGEETVALGPDESVVLAVPASAAASLLPGLTVPEEGNAIVNAHFRLDRPVDPPAGAPFIGVLGGTAHWVFLRPGMASVTVSGADALAEEPSETLAPKLWADVAAALGLPPEPLPPHRIVKEKRATFVQTPANLRRRPPARTALANLVLAGDWTDTGLPSTIEGSVRSGHTAADLRTRNREA